MPILKQEQMIKSEAIDIFAWKEERKEIGLASFCFEYMNLEKLSATVFAKHFSNSSTNPASN